MLWYFSPRKAIWIDLFDLEHPGTWQTIVISDFGFQATIIEGIVVLLFHIFMNNNELLTVGKHVIFEGLILGTYSKRNLGTIWAFWGESKAMKSI